MHQDQRIGLALGVLLVGACAAFFFRNETRELSNVPQLQHAEELDERIAERSSRPYLKGVEAVEASDRSRLRSDRDSHKSTTGSRDEKGASFWSPEEPFEDHLPVPASVSRERKPRARLTDSENEIQELAPIPVPTDNSFVQDRSRQSDRSESNGNSGKLSRPNDNGNLDSRTHVVQKGETLCSIATKFLGNPSRFHEIFEANTDQLNDANDVRQGMTLRIPSTQGGSVVRQPASRVSPVFEAETQLEVRPPLPLDSLQPEQPPALELPSARPKYATDAAPSILLPPELPNAIPSDPQLDVPSDSTINDDGTSPKRFVPIRKHAPPARSANPQAKANPRPGSGGRKLSQASLESTSGKVAR